MDTGEIEIEHFPTEMIWAYVLNNPKGGRHFCLYFSYLMNVPVDYDNDMELLKTHPDILPEADHILANSRRMRTPVHHRSVLGYNEIPNSQSAESRLVDSQFPLQIATNPNLEPNPNPNPNPGTQISWRNVVANRQ